METRTNVEIETRTDTVVQIGCIGCKYACAFGMSGLEGMMVQGQMMQQEVTIPYSLTEMAGSSINGHLVEASLNVATVYHNGGRSANDRNQCGDPCGLRSELIDVAKSTENAVNARGVATEHLDPY